jgi:hypothetical protein
LFFLHKDEFALVSSAAAMPRIKPIEKHPAGNENVFLKACIACDDGISCPTQSGGILARFSSGLARHNRANRRPTKAAVPINSSPPVPRNVGVLANVPIMRLLSPGAKRSFGRGEAK